jgi:nucleoside-diphosphate-sugar epimerase
MRVFVTGATGTVGRRLVPLLLGAAHAVTAVVRSRDKRAALERQGAATVEVDLFAREAVRRAIAGHDVVVNLATHIPHSSLRLLFPGAWSENDRIRRDASAVLVDAALAAGATRFVQESFAPIYEGRGEAWIDEDSPVRPVRYNRTTLDNVADDEPLTHRAYVDAAAAALGVPSPRLPPRWLGRLMGSLGELLSRSQRISSAKLRRASGWSPRYASAREGWLATVAQLRTAPALGRAASAHRAR